MTPAAAPDPDFHVPDEPVPPPFAVRRVAAPDGVALLELEGEMDIAAAERFREHVEQLADGDEPHVVLDMAEVGFIDSSALKELLRARAEITERGGGLTLAALRPGVRRLLDLTRTAELFEIVDSREAALARRG